MRPLIGIGSTAGMIFIPSSSLIVLWAFFFLRWLSPSLFKRSVVLLIFFYFLLLLIIGTGMSLLRLLSLSRLVFCFFSSSFSPGLVEGLGWWRGFGIFWGNGNLS